MIGNLELNLLPLTLFFGFMVSVIALAVFAEERRRRGSRD